MSFNTEIESLKRATVQTEGTTAGDVRRALEDARIPDYADILDMQFGCDHIEREEYTVADFEANEPTVKHEAYITLILEWEA